MGQTDIPADLRVAIVNPEALEMERDLVMGGAEDREEDAQGDFETMTLSTLDLLAEAAGQGWLSSELSEQQLADLRETDFGMGAIPGLPLAQAGENTVLSDLGAAGRDWLMDGTLSGDPGSLLAAGERTLLGVDLLPELGEQTLLAMADTAALRWQQTGLSDEQLAALSRITYRVEDLAGSRLGLANGATVVIDLDAAGRGWFIDGTPFDDAEFDLADSGSQFRATGGTAAGGYDLLSALMHEQGHILGLLDEYQDNGDLMYGFIQAGERRLAQAGQAEGAVAGTLAGDNYLTAAFVWNGGAGSVTDAAMWAGGVAPSAMDDLVFAGTGGVVDFSGLPAGTRFNSIMITGSGYTLTGNSIELYGGLTVNNTTGTNTVALDITLVNAQTIMNANAGSVLDITGAIHTGNLLGHLPHFRHLGADL